MREADFYEHYETEKLACKLCPHGCVIATGKVGLCGVRSNKEGKLIADSYGRITSISLDPIEKKPLYHFHPGKKILSIGSYGCNFRCGFCQNHEISMNTPSSQMMSPQEIAALSKELSSQDNIGVAFTYNEPTIGIEFLTDCAKLILDQGQKNVVVTNGFICEQPLMTLLPLIHAMNIDLKSFEQPFYKAIRGDVSEVKRTIKTAAKHCHVEVTTLIIEGENDSVREMEMLSEWLSDIHNEIPLHISRFYPIYQYKDRNATPVSTIYRLVETAKRHLKYVYPGNC